MAAGDFYIRKNASETTALPNAGSTLDLTWDTEVQDEGGICSYASGKFQLDIGLYFIAYSELFDTTDTTNNERIQASSELHIDGVGAVGGWDGGYIRKSSGDQEMTLNGYMILPITSDNTDIFIRTYRTDNSTAGTVNRVGGYGGVSILELDDTNHNFCRTSITTSESTSAATERTLAIGTSGTYDIADTGFSVSGNQVTVTNAGRYLCLYTMDLSQTATGRETIMSRIRKNSSSYITGTQGYCYLRGADASQAGGLAWAGILDLAASDTLDVRWSCTTNATITASNAQFQLWELPSSADTFIAEATTGDYNANADFAWDTNPHIDTDSFTHTAGTSDVAVDQNDHCLVFATFSQPTDDSPQRAVPLATIKNGGDTVDHICSNDYHRNSSTIGFALNVGGLVPLMPSGAEISIHTEPTGVTGTLTCDLGQFSVLSLESIWDYVYDFPIQITDVDTDETISNSQSNVVITGISFKSTQSTGKVELVENADYTGTKVEQTSVDSWGDESIQVDISAGALSDTNCYLFVTNSASDSAYIAVQVGAPPETYQESVEGITPAPSHYWTFQNTYDDEIGSATANASSGGTITFPTSPLLCKGDTHSMLIDNQSDYCSPADQSDMNTSSQNRRYFGGWFRLSNISQGLAVIYEEGAQVNNIAFLNGFGNNAIVQIANASDDYVQLYLDRSLAPNRAYHIMWKFVASGQDSGVCKLWLDGVEQTNTDGNPWETAQLDSHSGNITWGHEGTESLKVGDDRGVDATTIAFVSPTNCNYAHWYNWSGTTLSETDIRETLFEKGARADYTIAAGTETTMQTAFDAYKETLYTDSPCIFEIAECTDGDFTLVLDDVTFEDRVSMQFRYMGTSELTLRLENGSEVDTDKLAKPNGGTYVIEKPASFTVDGLATGSMVSIFDDEVSDLGNHNTRLAFIASSGSSFAFAHAGVTNTVIVQVIHQDYEELELSYTLNNTDQTLSVIKNLERNI